MFNMSIYGHEKNHAHVYEYFHICIDMCTWIHAHICECENVPAFGVYEDTGFNLHFACHNVPPFWKMETNINYITIQLFLHKI